MGILSNNNRSMLMIVLSTLSEQAFDLWQKLQLGFEFGSNPRDTVDLDRTWFVDFNAGKNQLVSFDRSHNCCY